MFRTAARRHEHAEAELEKYSKILNDWLDEHPTEFGSDMHVHLHAQVNIWREELSEVTDFIQYLVVCQSKA